MVATVAITWSSAAAQAPPTPAQTSVPGHPLQVRFGPTPSTETSLAGPNTEGLARFFGAEAVRRQFGYLVPTTLPGFLVTAAEGRGSPGLFDASVWFRGTGGPTTVRISGWTKVGVFLIAVPANSPVTEVTQTTISGLQALTLMPTAAVVGGLGPRTIYLTDGSTIWSIEIEGFSDNSAALELVRTAIEIVTVPGPPGTGTGRVSVGTDYRKEIGLAAGFVLAVTTCSARLLASRRNSRFAPATND